MNTQFVDVKGVRTRYLEEGSGDPIVLVHGGQYGSNSNAYNWKLNFEGLSKHFHIYALDKFGMGHTDIPQSDDEYTIDPVVKHAHDFFDAVGIEKATLVGHSRGGLLATRMSVKYPDRISTLIVVDSGSVSPTDPGADPAARHWHEGLGRSMEGPPTMENVEKEPIAYSYSRKHITEDFLQNLYEVANLPKTIQAKEKMKVLGGKLFYPSIRKVKDETLEMIEGGSLKAPTLVVWGLNDYSADVKNGVMLAQIIGKKVKRTQMHIINEAGHFVFREQPEEFNKAVLEFTGKK